MPCRCGSIALLLFALAMMNYIDRVVLSYAAESITRELELVWLACWLVCLDCLKESE